MTVTILKYTESYKIQPLERSQIRKKTVVIGEEQNPTQIVLNR